ncbi:protein PIMREG isoform X2 [Anolis carolinensis]|uniref:protein PIMREG isoform X2 n=1 Tax=Anolis carolinensis TaxID=28377 RepID=UPI002F2B8AEF
MASLAWRQHQILPDLEESPEPDRFRKKPSLDLRRSLRKRMPLRETGVNFAENPTWESLEAKEKPGRLRSSLKKAFGAASQKIQGHCRGPARMLAASLAKIPNNDPQTRSALAPSTPTSRARIMGSPSSGEASPLRLRRDRLPLRRSLRAAALRSPYASPASISQRKRSDGGLESVSRGIRRLKRLSQAFNDIIVQEESDMTVSLICH